jgi:uncharacterized protein (DUF885 family)
MKQLNLFDDDRPLSSRPETLVMSRDTLIQWKQRILEHQQQVRQGQQPQQQTLFDLPKTTWHTVDEIDPFALQLHPADFYRKPEPLDNSNQGCIYFLIDRTAQIILYIGETKLTVHQRWSGVHYAKDYTLYYIEQHRRYGLEVAVCSAFWLSIPPDKKILRQWERELIYKWRSPFNQECWQWLGQPFGKF